MENMNTITIPKTLSKKGDLVVIPRKQYEKFLHATEELQMFTELGKDLRKSLREAKTGKIFGPFSSAKELEKSLEK
jgi:RNase P protein component